MPVIIIVVAFLILGWSQWSNRQSLSAMSSRIEGLVGDLCAGRNTASIRWADATVREAVTGSVSDLCGSSRDSWTIVAVNSSDEEQPGVQIRIAQGNQNVMTLHVEELPGDKLLVRGWSSE